MNEILMALRGFNEPMRVLEDCSTYEWQGVIFVELTLAVNRTTKVTIAQSKGAQAIEDASGFEKTLTPAKVSDLV